MGRDLFEVGDVPSTPSVLRPELEDDQVPETVYLPSERVVDPQRDVTLELRALRDGTLAMPAYTSLRQLVDSCGDGQPWVAVRDYQVEDLRRVSGAEVIVWDAALPYDQRRSRAEQG